MSTNFACFQGLNGRFIVREDQIIHAFKTDKGFFYGVSHLGGSQVGVDFDTQGPFASQVELKPLSDALRWVAEWE